MSRTILRLSSNMTIFRRLADGASSSSSVSSLVRVPRTETGFLNIGLTGVAGSMEDPLWPRRVEVRVVMEIGVSPPHVRRAGKRKVSNRRRRDFTEVLSGSIWHNCQY